MPLPAATPPAPTGFADIALVRILVDSNDVSIGEYRLSFALLHDGAPHPEVDTTILALARRTGEVLPGATVVEHPDRSRYVAVTPRSRFPGLEMLGRFAINFMTLGLVHPAIPIVRREGTPAYTETIQPTLADYIRVSPRAVAVQSWLEDPPCDGPGRRCERWRLWPRTDVPRALTVVLRPDGYRGSAIIYTLPLPPGPLEQALAARFGDRMRTLGELASAAGTTPQVTYRLPDHTDLVTGRLTDDTSRNLCRLIRGTRRHPGLQGRPGLRYVLGFGLSAQGGERKLLALRERLLACGVTPDQIELASDDSYSVELRVRHDLLPP